MNLSRDEFDALMDVRHFGPRMMAAMRLVVFERYTYRMAAEAVGYRSHRDLVRNVLALESAVEQCWPESTSGRHVNTARSEHEDRQAATSE